MTSPRWCDDVIESLRLPIKVVILAQRDLVKRFLRTSLFKVCLAFLVNLFLIDLGGFVHYYNSDVCHIHVV